ncbi:alkaline phosphatase D family protein [Parafrankia sp. EUN1f]|uniref:alkaline phosphatase D family protein n=1 Tax=Parafrankia sp. EUN1f TaxID=102897 RepID=UPI0001C44D4B|nr:alkaline phosphatase D family protein [Parafrankia sp. EUN1f]EFC86593.1 hypothetical protein FrEUN1fDRAFT_0278 [Parafrankia sp. EUN1f]
MSKLLLGPLHRYADDRHATVWVETDQPCTVEVRAEQGPRAAAPTFTIAGHHFALVTVGELEPGRAYPYEVWLTRATPPDEAAARDDTPPGRAVLVWPEPGSAQPPSLLRPLGAERPVRLAFGSCRVTAPQTRPYTLSPEADPRGLGTDALHALALSLATTPPQGWPDVLLLLGDQVYADHVSPDTAERIRRRRDVGVPPGTEIADFTEYAWLYQEAWSQPEIRWLLSTIPTAMIGDDHDVRDDWNISASWRAEIRAQPWWDTRITSGIMAYWVYQHLGNLDPRTLAADPTYAAVAAVPDGEDVVRAFARRVDRMPDLAALADLPAGDLASAADGAPADDIAAGACPPVPPRWSFRWDLGRTRLIVIDSRLGRVVAPDGTRAMVNDTEWSWIREQTFQQGEIDHLLLGTSVPFLLTPTIHHVEAMSERLASTRFGERFGGRLGGFCRWFARTVTRPVERVRRTLDLEHWAAFSRSFTQMSQLLEAVAGGEHGPAPASVVVLSGDVHHAYLARVCSDRAMSPVWQAVCSPLRNPLGPGIRRIDALSRRAAFATVSGWLARFLGVRGMSVRWAVTHGPWFDSQLATLELDGRTATLLLDKTEPDGEPAGLEEILRVTLSQPLEPGQPFGAGQPKR